MLRIFDGVGESRDIYIALISHVFDSLECFGIFLRGGTIFWWQISRDYWSVKPSMCVNHLVWPIQHEISTGSADEQILNFIGMQLQKG